MNRLTLCCGVLFVLLLTTGQVRGQAPGSVTLRHRPQASLESGILGVEEPPHSCLSELSLHLQLVGSKVAIPNGSDRSRGLARFLVSRPGSYQLCWGKDRWLSEPFKLDPAGPMGCLVVGEPWLAVSVLDAAGRPLEGQLTSFDSQDAQGQFQLDQGQTMRTGPLGRITRIGPAHGKARLRVHADPGGYWFSAPLDPGSGSQRIATPRRWVEVTLTHPDGRPWKREPTSAFAFPVQRGRGVQSQGIMAEGESVRLDWQEKDEGGGFRWLASAGSRWRVIVVMARRPLLDIAIEVPAAGPPAPSELALGKACQWAPTLLKPDRQAWGTARKQLVRVYAQGTQRVIWELDPHLERPTKGRPVPLRAKEHYLPPGPYGFRLHAGTPERTGLGPIVPMEILIGERVLVSFPRP